MSLKFRVQASDINQALDVVSIVTPRAATSAKEGNSGYLFVVRANGNCAVYSQEAMRLIRVGLAISEVEGEGAFVLPQEYVGGFKHLSGSIDFEAGKDGERFYVRYRGEVGNVVDRTTFDPKNLKVTDDMIESATDEQVLPASLLKKALDTVKGYLAEKDSKADEHYQTLQLFDTSKSEWAKGDGHMYAADGIRACFFFCEQFKGKGLGIWGQHLPQIMSFLSKCEGDVTFKTSDNMTFAINQDRVLGWVHRTKLHPKFSYYSTDLEKHVLRMDKDFLVRSLMYMREESDSKKDRVRVVYEAEQDRWVLRFFTSETSGSVEGIPVTVIPESEDAKTKGFAFNLSLSALLDLVSHMESKQISLRVTIVPPKGNRKEGALFRTIDQFWVDSNGKVLPGPENGVECRVTRFFPSKD